MRGMCVLSLAVAALAAGCGASTATTTSRPPQPKPLAIYADGVKLATLLSDRQAVRLPQRLSIRSGRARIAVDIPLQRAKRAVRAALRADKTRVDLPVVAHSSSIALRPVLQVLHNDCEATSLSMLLAAAGVRVGQLRLQAQLPRSGPLDPEPVAGSTLFRWGDPERGFVGRPAGGGSEGGFGVYEPPIRALATRYGVHLVDLHGRSVAAVRAVVLAGRPILAWVGLDAGPYLSWLTPTGRKITVNLDEHAVVLVGAGPGYVLVDNPLSGRRERWSESLFEYRWQLLGHRALALP
ncbi:MAG TPA: C39 family peptidase [Gaiellaceae bacterium]|nr:C39 family peptidase [Gaiellaceae bacterium]